MARKRSRSSKTSLADDIVDLVALAPWWVGVLLALLFYLWLHSIAIQPVTIVATPGKMGDMAVRSMVHALASYGQYLLPLLCCLGAALSAWRRYQRRALLNRAAHTPEAAQAIAGMSWQQFELLIGEAFRQQGYRVLENGGGGADGGVDLVLSRGGEKFLVQCKQWRAYKVGVEVARELYGLMAAGGAAGGFVVTSGRFTEEAARFASGRNLTLVDGPKLQALLKQARAARQATPEAPLRAPAPAASPAIPSCPRCGAPMVRRVARQGTNAGKPFWGCTTYPACRGTCAAE